MASSGDGTWAVGERPARSQRRSSSRSRSRSVLRRRRRVAPVGLRAQVHRHHRFLGQVTRLGRLMAGQPEAGVVDLGVGAVVLGRILRTLNEVVVLISQSN